MKASLRTDPAVYALGAFSLGLGLAELLMPRLLARAFNGTPAMVRACGLREIGTGIGLLTARDPTPWMWGRVAGDALDLAGLARRMAGSPGQKAASGAALAAVAGVTALDIGVAQALSDKRARAERYAPDYSDRTGFPVRAGTPGLEDVRV